MEQVQMEYREMDIWKVNEFNFLNEEIYMYVHIYIYIYIYIFILSIFIYVSCF